VPSFGQRYQMPAGYEGSAVGSVISYGGASYVVAGDGTMTAYAGAAQGGSNAAQTTPGPVAGQRYQIPTELAGTAAGNTITYGGYNYLVRSDGTMTYYTGPAQRDANVQQTADSGRAPGQRYQVPTEFASSEAGSFITYAGYNYLVNNDGTMTALAGPIPKDSSDKQAETGPIPGRHYQIPADLAKSAAGSVVTYKDHDYVIGNDGTMTSIAQGSPKEPEPVPGQRYPIPPEFAASAPGSAVTYKGHDYVIGNDGMMTYVTVQFVTKPR
jgi:hypothetical protein